jgi:hypothetical protein
VPAVPSCILEPLWDQFQALLAARSVSHPLGCHRPRVPDRVIFDKLIQVLVFGCGDRRIAGQGCSATTLRRRRDEWIALRLAEHLHQLALHAYDRLLAWSWTTWPLTAASQGALRRPGRRAKPGGSPHAGPETLPGDRGARPSAGGSPGPGQSPRRQVAGGHPGSGGGVIAAAVGPLPAHPVVQLDAGYDYQPCRQVLADRSLAGQIAARGQPAPIQAG